MTTTISLIGYERESLTNPTLPSELRCEIRRLYRRGEAIGFDHEVCEASYQEADGSGEAVLYHSLDACLEAHEIDPGHLVDWLDDQGQSIAASYVAAKTDPHRAERAQAAAKVVSGITLTITDAQRLTMRQALASYKDELERAQEAARGPLSDTANQARLAALGDTLGQVAELDALLSR